MMLDALNSQLEAGYGEQDITPPLGTELGGFGFYLERYAEAVASPLKVRALALSVRQNAAVLVSADLLGFTVAKSDDLRQQIARTCGLPAQNVLVACTHTHASPPTQPMPGLGQLDPSYLVAVEERVVQAARTAWEDRRPAQFRFVQQAAEPIGYNRTRGDFCGVDPNLNVLTFEREVAPIHLLNYACHPVTLGPTRVVSADYPGALVSEIENRSDAKALFFQGFSGDIDPVVNLNHWSGGSLDDVRFYGRLLAERVLRPTKPTTRVFKPRLVVQEKRIDIPLNVGPKDEIPREKERFLQENAHFPGVEQFAEYWQQQALENHDRLSSDPFVRDVPVQALRLGPVKLIAFPGEVFSAFGVRLRQRVPDLVPLGYANGNIGYVPTARAYRNRHDYAAHAAPKFYTIFPFSAEVGRILIRTFWQLLKKLDTGRD